MSIEELEKDKQDIISQITRMQGALIYVNQKIAAIKGEDDKKHEPPSKKN